MKTNKIEESVKYQFLKLGKWLLIGWLVFLYLFVQYLNCGYFFQTDVMSNAALVSEVLLLYFSNRLVSTKYLYLGLAVQVLLIFWLALFFDNLSSLALLVGFMPICIVEEITYQYPKRYFVMTALYGLCVFGFGLLQDGLDFFNFILLAEAVAMIALLAIYYYQMIYRQAFQAQYLQEVNEELNQAYAQVEEATTKAVKQTLARDLHDSLTQDLIGINMHLSAMKALLDNEDYQKLAQTLEKTQHLTKESISEARQTIADYRQEKRDNLTLQLREELQKRLTNLQENYHLNTQLAMPDEIELSYHQGMDVLRMINEALMNVIKHAEIDQVKVDVKKEGKMLQIHVINFGKPMRLLAQNNQHFGLLGMKERAAQYNGQVSINSSKNTGTVVTIELEVI